MPTHIFWRDIPPEALQSKVHAELGSGATITFEKDKNKFAPHLADIDILVDGNPPTTLLDGPNLKHVIVPWAGVSPELRQAVLERPHLKLYNSHYNAPFVAQHAIALLLACAHRLLEVDHIFRQGNWQHAHDPAFHSVFLRGKTCLLLGYGAIGKHMVPMLHAFGMKVAVVKRRPEENTPALDKIYGPERLRDAVQTADVIISLPLTPETEGLAGADMFAHMKPSTILVNVGRGAVIDQHALQSALHDKRILAAGLDVWWRYPESKEARARTFPADVPLHEHRSLIMSPHRADQVQESKEAQVMDVLQTIKSIVTGDPRNQVDPSRGY